MVGTLGLMSTCCSSSSFSYSFSLLLLLLVIGQILACLLLLLLSSQLSMLVASILRQTMSIYSSSSSAPLPSAITATWDLVQASVPCCGVIVYSVKTSKKVNFDKCKGNDNIQLYQTSALISNYPTRCTTQQQTGQLTATSPRLLPPARHRLSNILQSPIRPFTKTNCCCVELV